jgi:UDP-N-acetylglucosamine 4,6-dehydratase
MTFFNDKVILVTGGVGSIGREIVKSLLHQDPRVVRIFDNNETGLFDIEHELQSSRIRVLLGDVRDKERLKRAFENVDIVFHAAALKHVPLCEYNAFEAVKTNVIGTQNLIEVAIDEKISKFITISSDKAVNPVNVMGATKLLAERLTISANFYKGFRKTAFSCVRFGNVLDTRGSVVPLFRKQIQNGFLTLTDPDMTRFMMSVPLAVELVLKAAEMAEGGEIFILKMPVLQMGDLADVIAEEYTGEYEYGAGKIRIDVIGKRAGEKMHEELMTADEAERAYEDEEMFVVLPQKMDIVGNLTYEFPTSFSKTKKEEYSSKNAVVLSKEEIRQLLR